MNRIGLVIAAIGFVAFAGSAAAGIKEINCTTGKCGETVGLSGQESMDFRGKCQGSALKVQKCTPVDSRVAGTPTRSRMGYSRRSCTNWDTAKTYNAKIQIEW